MFTFRRLVEERTVFVSMAKRYENIAVSFDESSNQANYIFSAAMMPVIFIYFEMILRLATGLEWSRSAWMYVLIYSLIAGSLLYLASTLFSYKVNRVIFLVVCGLIGFVYAVYEVYYSFFRAFIDMTAAGEAGNMFRDFLGNIVSCTFKNLHWIILFMLPLALFILLTKKTVRIQRTPFAFKAAVLVFMLVFLGLRSLLIAVNNGEYDDKFYYNEGYDVTISAQKFGLPTSIRLNIKYTIFGRPEAELTPPESTESVDIGELFGTTTAETTTLPAPPTGSGNSSDSTTEAVTTEPFVPVDRVLEINFEQLASSEKNNTIKAMHQYFGSLAPTKTNEYTGMFEGKNLIYITAEGFTDKIIDPQLTPTLYKIATQGFVFNNCYNSLWGGSTATGEYLSMTGLFYNSSACLKKSGGGSDGKARNMYYSLGNTFKREGYETIAFHNHNPKYYSRHLSHPNFGFKFIGANGNYDGYVYSDGITYPTNAWPKSDLEMAQLSTSYYIDSEKPFCAYYMTVSGHANYNWGGNNMSKKHRAEVASLPYSEEVKAYIACNLELELMLKNLIEQLDAKGILDDTVFVLSTDHYPYALSADSLSELYALPKDGILENFDLYRNKFFIWSASMDKPVVVNKYCSSMDIIPTVYNLFGVEYDSRLLMGIDVMSNAAGLVILNTHGSSWNWITDYGYYSTASGSFTPHPGVSVGSDSALRTYVNNMKSIVANKRKYSLAILDNDYYKYVFG